MEVSLCVCVCMCVCVMEGGTDLPGRDMVKSRFLAWMAGAVAGLLHHMCLGDLLAFVM